MYKIHDNVFKKCFNSLDVVSDKDGNVGYISEININDSQSDEKWQLSYSVNWLMKKTRPKNAWWGHDQLTKHSNIMDSFSRGLCHPFGSGEKSLKMLSKWRENDK